MKIGIIVYSKTGNTYSVAKRIKDNLIGQVDLIRLDFENEVPPFKILTEVDLTSYDFIVFASPVEAFRLNQRMSQYLNEISNLSGKEVYLFVTQYFKYPWLGGNNAIKQMINICQNKNAEVYGTKVINWTNKKREQQILELVNSLKNIKI